MKKKENDYYFTFLKDNNFHFRYEYLYQIIELFDIIIDKSSLPLNLCYITLKGFSDYNDNVSIYDFCNNDNIVKSIKLYDSIELIIEKIKKRIPHFYKLDFLDNFFNDKNQRKFNTYFEYKSNKEFNNQINLYEYNKNLIKELIKEKRNLKLFHLNFISTNRDKCKLIINGEEFELFEEINFKFFLENKELEIKIKQINPITDMSFMFAYSDSLAFITDISNLDTSKVTNMECMFLSCKYIPDISNWDTSNVRNMSSIFSNCGSLELLPDISKWNTKNVTNLGHFCSFCFSLKYLPDISNWNTSNVKDMSSMFEMCWSLKAFPDISKWDTSNVNDMTNMFSDCFDLKTLPDISKWNIKNVQKINHMFFRLKQVGSFPDISQWEINAYDIRDISGIFVDCCFNPIIHDNFEEKYKNLNK